MKNLTFFSLCFCFLTVIVKAQNPCDTTIWQERNGIVVIEPEQISTLNGWVKRDSLAGFTGSGYIVWTGAQYFNSAANGQLSFKANITTAGKYAFDLRAAITFGTLGTEHNDIWVSITGVDNFFGEKTSVNPVSLVKPKPDCNNNPTYKCPVGSSVSGYFKVFGGRLNAYQWKAVTSDSDDHLIYFEKNTPGIVSVNIAARSSFFAIDRMVLYKTPNVTANTARNTNLNWRDYRCGATSTKETSDPLFKVYPNPSNDYTLVEVANAGSLAIIDMQGKVLSHQNLSSGQQVITTDFLAKGVYLMRFTTEKQVKMHKLIKE